MGVYSLLLTPHRSLTSADSDDDFQLIAVIKHFLLETAARYDLAVSFQCEAFSFKLKLFQHLCDVYTVVKVMGFAIDGKIYHFAGNKPTEKL